jgi:uncharacterized membrane protein
VIKQGISKIIKGFMIFIPIIIIIILSTYFYNFISDIVKYVFDISNNNYKLTSYIISSFLLIFFILGYYYEKKQKTFVLDIIENIVKKVPFIKDIYFTISDMLDLLLKDNSYLGVIEIEYGGYLQYGFITKDLVEEDRYIVFIPTAPNPTNGFVILLEKNNPKYPYKKIDLEPKKAMGRIISLGMK